MSDTHLRRGVSLLSSVGLGIAGYLTYVHYAGLAPVCGISHGCETVQTSQYAYLGGVPVAVLGLISYVVVLLTSLSRGERALLAGAGVSLISFAFSVYLTYRELFTIHAICSWCVSSAVVFTLLTVVSGIRAVRGSTPAQLPSPAP
jgi:uncharacterized membrane protein